MALDPNEKKQLTATLEATEKNLQELCEGLAPTYAGRTCPLKNGGACDGPRCMWFAAFDSNPDPSKPGRVTNGACSYLLSAQQLNQMAVGLENLAHAMGNFALSNSPRLIKPQ